MSNSNTDYKYGKSTYVFFSLLSTVTAIVLFFIVSRWIGMQNKPTITVTCTKIVDLTTTNQPLYRRYYSDGFSEKTDIFSPKIRIGEDVVFYKDGFGRIHKKGLKQRVYWFLVLMVIPIFAALDNYVKYHKLSGRKSKPFIVKLWGVFEKKKMDE